MTAVAFVSSVGEAIVVVTTALIIFLLLYVCLHVLFDKIGEDR